MTTEILHKMEERRIYKEDMTEDGQKQYKQLKSKIQRLCRKAKNDYFNEKCAEIEKLEKTHNPRFYTKIKEMTPKRHMNSQTIKDKDGKLLYEPEVILERWAQYVEDCIQYSDNRSSDNNDINTTESCTISEMEIRTIITKLTRNKATGADNIPAEFLQSLGEKGIQTMTRLMNKIYNTGNLPDDFLQNIFITYQR